MKSLFELVRKRPILSSMLFLMVEFMGIIAFYNSRFSLFPVRTYPGLTINLDYPGADANKIEKMITLPIEEVIASIGGIQEIRSFTETGKAKLNVQFQNNVDLDFKNLELKERIELIASSFPRETRKPTVFKYDPEQVPILIYNLKSERIPLDEIREIVERGLKPELENIEGISQVIIAGGRNREVIIACDKLQLESFKISLRDVVSAIQANNKLAGIGTIENNKLADKVYSDGKLRDIFQIRDLSVFINETTNITKIKDIARVSLDFREEDNSSRINSQETVGIYIYKTFSGNPLEISSLVEKNIQNFNFSNITVLKSYNLAETIEQAFYNLIFCVFLGLFICVFFFYFITKSTRLILLHILNLLSSFQIIFILLRVFDISFNILSSTGIILGICLWNGALSLIFIQNKKTKIEMKYDNYFKEYFLFSFLILSLCLSLRPLNPLDSQNMFIVSITAVLFFWINFISFPILYVLVEDKKIKYSINKIRYKKIFYYLKFLLGKIFHIDSELRKDIKDKERIYALVLIGIILYGLYILFTIDRDSDFAANKKELVAFIELPSGTGFDFTNEITKKIEKKLIGLKGIEEVMAKVEPSHSLLILKIAEGIVTDTEYINFLKSSVGNISPAFLYFSSDSSQGSMLEMNIDVIGNDLDELDRIVKELNDKAKGIKGINEVILRYKPPREELSLVLDDYNLLKAKLSNAEVGDFLKLAIQGGVATKFIYNEREIDVRVRFAEQYRNSERSLSEIRIKNRDNKFVPITDISTQKESLAPLKIYHKNKRRMLSFAMRMQNMSQSDIIKTIENLRTIKLPENYRLEFDKIFESKEKGGKNNLLQIGLILILFYMILASYSESFTYPIIKIIYLPATIAILFIIQKYVSGKLTLSAYIGLFLSLAIQIYFFVILDRNNSRHSRRLILYSTLPNLGFFIAFLFFSFGSVAVIFDILFYYFLSVLLSLCLYPVYKSIFGNLESINRRNMR